MKRRCALLAGSLFLLASTLACNLPALSGAGETAAPAAEEAGEPATAEPPRETPSPTALPPSEGLILPEELEYLGAFRLPEGSGGSNWEYGGQGLTYYPDGDPDGPDDGFPGSLFGIGHDQQLYVSEISIPAPVISDNVEDLNVAATLQPFGDLTGGIFNAEEVDLPVADLAYLPPQGEQTSGKLHFVWGWHFQEFGDPSHGWAEVTLSDPRSAGPWALEGFTNYVTSDYLFEIPEAWAAQYTPGLRLATGRFREGVWGGRGPALFAYGPWNEGNPPPPGATLSSVTPLLLYGHQEPGAVEIVSDESTQMNGYQEADHWWGGAWLTAGGRSAVIFVGTKAMGRSWYGFANGVVWPYDCAEQTPPTCPEPPEWPYDDRGYWAEDYQAQIIFYNPADLAAVAQGRMESWEPQPYAVLVVDDVLFDPQLRPEDYKRDLLGAAAFDREHGLLYVVERLADEYRPVIHVWRVNG